MSTPIGGSVGRKTLASRIWRIGLLDQILDQPDWYSRAQCRGVSPSIMFPERGRARYGEMISIAKSICRACEVRYQCLDYAIDTNQMVGIWGGMTPLERKRVKVVSKA